VPAAAEQENATLKMLTAMIQESRTRVGDFAERGATDQTSSVSRA
jgi:hypothetical protein